MTIYSDSGRDVTSETYKEVVEAINSSNSQLKQTRHSPYSTSYEVISEGKKIANIVNIKSTNDSPDELWAIYPEGVTPECVDRFKAGSPLDLEITNNQGMRRVVNNKIAAQTAMRQMLCGRRP